jgi:hypothetical protein
MPRRYKEGRKARASGGSTAAFTVLISREGPPKPCNAEADTCAGVRQAILGGLFIPCSITAAPERHGRPDSGRP